MTLETKINHEPLLNYLRVQLPECRPISDENSPYSLNGPSLVYFGKVKDYAFQFGNLDTLRMNVLHPRKNSLGWYVLNAKVSKGKDAKVLIFDIAKVGSKEAYEFAMEYAAKREELELAATFRDLMRSTESFDAAQLFHPPKRYPWKQIAAGIVIAGLGAFGTVSYIDHKVESTIQSQQLSAKRDFWQNTNNLLQQGLNASKFPLAQPEALWLHQSYHPAVVNAPASYEFLIRFNGLDGRTLPLLIDEKTGEWWNKNADYEQMVRDYGLESVIEHLQKRVKDNNSAR